MPVDLQFFAVVMAMELAALASVQTVALVLIVRWLMQAIQRRDTAERLLNYRRPLTSPRVHVTADTRKLADLTQISTRGRHR